jgi:hypothetical protein
VAVIPRSGRKNLRRHQLAPMPLGPRRSVGSNPRARGTNPRARGTNPRAFAGDGTQARFRQTQLDMRRASRRIELRAWRRRSSEQLDGVICSSPTVANPTVSVDGVELALCRSGGLEAVRAIREQLEQLDEGGEPP